MDVVADMLNECTIGITVQMFLIPQICSDPTFVKKKEVLWTDTNTYLEHIVRYYDSLRSSNVCASHEE